LPPSGSGERARRRRQRRRLTWRRHSLLLAIGVIVVVATLAAVRPWHGGSTRSASRPQTATPVHVAPLTSAAVLVQQDAQGAASSITLLVASPSGHGGHVVFVPPATMTEVPSFGLDAVGRGLALGGAPVFQVTLETLLGVPLPPVTIVKDAQLTSFVQGAGPLPVDVPGRVEQTDARGNVNVFWEQGPATVAPADVPRFLSAPAQGNDLARLARHQSFWTAWLARVGRDQGTLGAVPP